MNKKYTCRETGRAPLGCREAGRAGTSHPGLGCLLPPPGLNMAPAGVAWDGDSESRHESPGWAPPWGEGGLLGWWRPPREPSRPPGLLLRLSLVLEHIFARRPLLSSGLRR